MLAGRTNATTVRSRRGRFLPGRSGERAFLHLATWILHLGGRELLHQTNTLIVLSELDFVRQETPLDPHDPLPVKIRQHAP